MNFVRINGLLVVHLKDPRSTKPSTRELYELGKVNDPVVERIIEAFKRKLIGSPFRSQVNGLGCFLRPLGVFLNSWIADSSKKTVAFDLASWQACVCDFAVWWLVRDDSKATLATRCGVWQRVVIPFFEYLQEEDVLPFGLVFPKLKLPKEQTSSNPQQPKLIGESPAMAVSEEHAIEKAPLDRTLAGPVFWRADAEYLDEIETTLRERDAMLASALDDYWLKLIKDYRTGWRLKRQISDVEWHAQEAAGDWAYGYYTKAGITFDDPKVGRRMPLCTPLNPRGHVWLLRFLQHFLLGLEDAKDFNLKAIQTHPAVCVSCFKHPRRTPIEPLRRLTALSNEQFDVIPTAAFFWRFFGLLSMLDMAVAITILIREHANWTPEAIAGAKLLDAHGKSYLLITDSTNPAEIFSVDKPRAGSRKCAILSKRSIRVVRHLLRATAPVRDVLRRSGNPHWRYLFLGYMRHKGLGHPSSIPSSLLNRREMVEASLVRFYPKLTQAGLGVGTLDFSKVRATQGVLAWFDKGSVKAVKQRLGNSYRVSIEHYIPETLLAAWNERIIRRFQNTLVVLAAAEEDYLLEVVDMPSLADLHRFLAQLVYELPPGRSPIADRLQARFGERYRIDEPESENLNNQKKTPKESLHVRLNPSCIALLLAYREWAKTQLSPAMQQQADRQTGLTPAHFIELAGMLQSAAQSDQIGKDLSRVLNVKLLRQQFAQAEPKVAALAVQLDKKSLTFEGKNHERCG
ncbi:hypothetical protein RVM24_18965 [Marinobacter sp. KM021]|uniref:hypothetical protein n=1 Tax=Marinobacter sp. KM021 TaxID=3075616 RepID=UPI003D6A03EA